MPLFERLKRCLLPGAAPEAGVVATDVQARDALRSDAAEAPALVVIDVRSEREFEAASIDRAVNLPLPQLARRIAEFAADRATPLVLYCASGARSGAACGVLRQLGYSEVTNAGGLYEAAERLQRAVRH